MKTANLTSVAIAALLGIIMLAGAGCKYVKQIKKQVIIWKH